MEALYVNKAEFEMFPHGLQKVSKPPFLTLHEGAKQPHYASLSARSVLKWKCWQIYFEQSDELQAPVEKNHLNDLSTNKTFLNALKEQLMKMGIVERDIIHITFVGVKRDSEESNHLSYCYEIELGDKVEIAFGEWIHEKHRK